MKRCVWIVLASCFFFAAGASAQVSTYTALLKGVNETPVPADPDGIGFAVITFDQGAGTITFTAYAQNIASVTASHIHRGAAGVDKGTIIIPFNQPFVNGVSSGTLTGIAPSFMAEVVANPPGYYFNVHTADFPNGAIRGQLQPAPGTAAPNVFYLPVTVKVTGARGENFVQDVRIVSRASATANVTVDYFASNAAGLAGPTATKTVSVAVNQQLVLNDILGSTFNTSGIGALRFTTDRDVIVEGRVLDDRRSSNQGQLGFFVHGLGIDQPCRFGTLPVLSQASASDATVGIGLRTNIGYFNPNALPVSATFTARKTSDGSSLGAVTVTIPSLSHAQFRVFDLINTVAAADQVQADFYVTYSVAPVTGINFSGGPLFVYTAVGDNFTGDSYYTAGVCGQ